MKTYSSLAFCRFHETEEELLNRVYEVLKKHGLQDEMFHLEFDWTKSKILSVVFNKPITIGL